MKSLLAGVLILCCMGGCAGLSAEQTARIEAIAKENETLAIKMAALIEKAKKGEISPTEIIQAVEEVRNLMDKNRTEIKSIQESATSKAAVWGGIAGLVGRTVLHGAASAIPGAGPVAAMLQGLLTLLLGGSTTKKKEA